MTNPSNERPASSPFASGMSGYVRAKAPEPVPASSPESSQPKETDLLEARRKFEEWADGRVTGHLIHLERNGEGYLAEAVQRAWEPWKKGCQAGAAEARRDEREQCAKIAENHKSSPGMEYDCFAVQAGKLIAAAIRARSEG